MIAAMAAATMPGAVASAAPVLFNGSYSNLTPPPTPDPSCPPGHQRLSITPENSAQTSTSDFGSFDVTLSHCITLPPFSYTGGDWRFDFTGGWLSGTAAGDVTSTATPDLFDIAVEYIVTDGGGMFLGATGIIYGSGTLDRRTLPPANMQTLRGLLDVPAIPEPASWAMMITGLGLAGAAMRRRPERTIALA